MEKDCDIPHSTHPQGMTDMHGEYEVNRDAGPDRARRTELMALAANIAVLVEGSTAPRERCILRRMVEILLGE